MKPANDLASIRRLLAFFMTALLLSGLTAVPVLPELDFVLRFVPRHTPLFNWLFNIRTAYAALHDAHPFLLYAYDWLAFAHVVLALLFIGPYVDPVRNIWVIRFGMIACGLVLPAVFIAGPARGIPIGWQIVDCSFGVFGFLPLYACYRKAKRLEAGRTAIIKKLHMIHSYQKSKPC